MLNSLVDGAQFDLTNTPLGIAALIVFVGAYLLVVLEERIKLRKSKPVLLGAAILWILTSIGLQQQPNVTGELIEQRVSHYIAEYGALFLFLMVAMTYISAIAAHNVFLKLNAWLVASGYGYRAVFWATGILAFWISPVADNMTTALLMGAVVVAVGKGDMRFIAPSCCSIVIAANAGGAFSPFGDITTLMVWAEDKVHTAEFLKLLPACIVNWLVPAAIMHFWIPDEKPKPLQHEVQLKKGWAVVIGLFLATIVTAVLFHMYLHLPPALGMTMGLGYYFIYGWLSIRAYHKKRIAEPLDVFKNVAEVEWDTMLFFFGVILCVGALRELGFLALASHALYDPVSGVGATWANIGMGVLSAVVDNVPLMFAVLSMNPPMDPAMPADVTHTATSVYQWLLITLTCGTGGSLLSVGSAAGVALMGSAHGMYTFVSHLKWLPAIAAGYAASILVHWLLNAA
ncbi:MAG: sodium:proton antiporter NhaD [Planctomycetes bacterium]|nr:sodium:proton antiporter NhaD [Planctomycetota bacterium]